MSPLDSTSELDSTATLRVYDDTYTKETPRSSTSEYNSTTTLHSYEDDFTKETPNLSHKPDVAHEEYPDGGVRAWLVVVGIFQAYYESDRLKDTTPSDIAWIGSLQFALIYLPGVVVGRLFDLGWFQLPFALGSSGIILSAFLTAQCKEYWHFVLVQGILLGLSCSVCYVPVVGLIGHWFYRWRGLAATIAATGSSLGATIIPIVARMLIPKVGSPAFTTYCLSALVAFLGAYTVPIFLGVSAEEAGVSAEFSFYLVSMRSASSCIGRIVTGLLVDTLGPVNVGAPMTVAMALISLLWPLAQTQNTLVAIALLYGFTSGTYTSTFQMPAYVMGEIEDVGRRAGMVMTFAALGAIAGPPISGALRQASGGFAAVGLFAVGPSQFLSKALWDILIPLIY
ncbi:hypothetical protein DXG01_016493 [Tephrocybe rancida]|nr:hypothetical protein DXG01_016493 [Tephrocybe rancida]